MIKVHRDLNKLPDFNNSVITIGSFDGVHTGHQQILKQLRSEAKNIGGETVIITFHPHPRKIVAGGVKEVKTLSTLDEKIDLLNAQRIEHLVVVPFDEAFASQIPEEYIENFIVKKFHPHTIIIGYDHRFGKGRAGDYHLLEELCSHFGYVLKEIPEHILNKVVVSSTQIRNALLNGEIALANELLGYAYCFNGTVIEGNKLGRTIGYPTANLQPDDEGKLIPGNGVYAVEVMIENIHDKFGGMMNIGLRPTVDGSKKVIEINVFDFDGMIYGRNMKVFVKAYLRSEEKFSGVEALKQQLSKDREKAEHILSRM